MDNSLNIDEFRNAKMNGKSDENDDVLEGDEIEPSSEYPYTQVKIDKEQFSLFELKRKHEDERRKDIIIDPEFQRNFVWTATQKSELVESILMGIPLPVIYLFEQLDGKKQVVDGRQRLTSIFEFMSNKFSLSELKILKTENGKKFEKLDPILQSKIEDYQIQAYLIKPPTPERIKFDIFDRVNRSGTHLNHQEMRNALYQGACTELLKKLAKTVEFSESTGKSVPDKRMKGRYIILRFLSFYMLFKGWLKHENIEYKSDIDDFLAKTMEFINKLEKSELGKLEVIFLKAMKNSKKIMGPDGFRFSRSITSGNRRPVNMALFEALAYIFSDLEIENMDPYIVNNRVQELKHDFDKSGFSMQVDSSAKVNDRFMKAEQLIKELHAIQN
jgi:hypothetical protein